MSFFVAGSSLALGVYQSNKAGDAADKANNLSKDAMGFEQQKYQDWQDVYGDIQANLGKYYNELTPETYAARGIQEFNKSNELEMEKIRTTLAQRGLMNSGTTTAVILASGLNAAERKAEIRSTADEVVKNEQERFLQIGLGQNPGASYSQMLNQRATQAENQAAYASAQAGKSIGTAVTTIGTALDDYYNKPKTPAFTGDIVSNPYAETVA